MQKLLIFCYLITKIVTKNNIQGQDLLNLLNKNENNLKSMIKNSTQNFSLINVDQNFLFFQLSSQLNQNISICGYFQHNNFSNIEILHENYKQSNNDLQYQHYYQGFILSKCQYPLSFDIKQLNFNNSNLNIVNFTLYINQNINQQLELIIQTHFIENNQEQIFQGLFLLDEDEDSDQDSNQYKQIPFFIFSTILFLLTIIIFYMTNIKTYDKNYSLLVIFINSLTHLIIMGIQFDFFMESSQLYMLIPYVLSVICYCQIVRWLNQFFPNIPCFYVFYYYKITIACSILIMIFGYDFVRSNICMYIIFCAPLVQIIYNQIKKQKGVFSLQYIYFLTYQIFFCIYLRGIPGNKNQIFENDVALAIQLIIIYIIILITLFLQNLYLKTRIYTEYDDFLDVILKYKGNQINPENNNNQEQKLLIPHYIQKYTVKLQLDEIKDDDHCDDCHQHIIQDCTLPATNYIEIIVFPCEHKFHVQCCEIQQLKCPLCEINLIN